MNMFFEGFTLPSLKVGPISLLFSKKGISKKENNRKIGATFKERRVIMLLIYDVLMSAAAPGMTRR